MCYNNTMACLVDLTVKDSSFVPKLLESKKDVDVVVKKIVNEVRNEMPDVCEPMAS